LRRITSYDAVVLAGGTSRRLTEAGVADKTRLEIGGVPLLDRVIAAVADARQVVVVGDPRPVGGRDDVMWVRESPPGAGPAAALGTGVAVTSATVVSCLAGDLPLLTAAGVSALVDALCEAGSGVPGVVAVDDAGREQWLCSAWWRTALAEIRLEPHASLGRSLVGQLGAPGKIRLPHAATLDCDTPADLAEARRRLDAKVAP
jgi:molybdopterin-guanine dinucleotide biosynthesis protein A